jgi:hypothetical protein
MSFVLQEVIVPLYTCIAVTKPALCNAHALYPRHLITAHSFVHQFLPTVLCVHKQSMYSGPSSYDRLDIQTTWVSTKILVLTYDQILSYEPHAGQGHLSYDSHGVRKLQSEHRYKCLWT